MSTFVGVRPSAKYNYAADLEQADTMCKLLDKTGLQGPPMQYYSAIKKTFSDSVDKKLYRAVKIPSQPLAAKKAGKKTKRF